MRCKVPRPSRLCVIGVALLHIVGGFLFGQLRPASRSRPARARFFKALAAHPRGDVGDNPPASAAKPRRSLRPFFCSSSYRSSIWPSRFTRYKSSIGSWANASVFSRMYRLNDSSTSSRATASLHHASPFAMVLMISPAIISPTTGGTKLDAAGRMAAVALVGDDSSAVLRSNKRPCGAPRRAF